METKIPFHRKFLYSIAKIEQFPKLAKEGVGRAFLYLLLFTLIFGTIQGFLLSTEINTGITRFVDEIEEGMPDFVLENGELKVEGKMPLILAEDADSIYIIDISGVTTPDILEDYQQGGLVLKDKIIHKPSSFETNIYSFNDLQAFTITKDDIVSYLPFLKFIGPIIGILAFIFFFIGKIISGLFLALIGLLITSIQKFKLSFGLLFSIGIYALTFPAILDTLFPIILNSNFPWFFYYFIAIVYTWSAISIFKKQAE